MSDEDRDEARAASTPAAPETTPQTARLEINAAYLSNRVYEACAGIFESLEANGDIHGNGHHMAQQVAKKAEDLLRERWRSS